MSTYLMAALVVAALVALARRADAPMAQQRPAMIAVAAVFVLLALDLLSGGLRFVPGLAATTPVAVFGLVRGWDRTDRRIVATIAVGALPLVWATQYTGGAGPQWGGRYILLTGLLGIVLASVTVRTADARRALGFAAAVGAIVTLAGVAWTVERSHAFDDTAEALAARPEPVVIFHDPFLARESGPIGLDRQWLAAPGEEARARAVEVVEDFGIDEVAFVDHADGSDIKPFPGWVQQREERIDLVSGLQLRVVVWRAP